MRTVSAGTVNASVEHELDEYFRVIRETVNGAWPVDFAYDVDGLLTQAGPVVITRDFATGFVTNTTIDGVTTATTYDDYGDRETYTASFGGTVLYSEAHERDDIGRITKTTEVVEGVTKVWEYAYDLDGRLAEAYVDGALRYSYTYDANGNRTSVEDPVAGTLVTADYDDQDRLLRHGDTTYTYTANGELLTSTSPVGTTTFDYDVFANLRSITDTAGVTTNYAVDPADRRVAALVAGVIDYGLVYRDALNPIARTDASGAVDQRYIYATRSHVPDAYTDGVINFAVINDIRGSVRLVVDATTGVVLQRTDYSPYGVASGTAGIQPFGFDGGINAVGGLVRFGARDYEPTRASWLTKDAARFAGGTSLFAFGRGDPINHVDLTGRNPLLIFLAPAKGLGGAAAAEALAAAGAVFAAALPKILSSAAVVAIVGSAATCEDHDEDDDELCFLRNVVPSSEPAFSVVCWYHCPTTDTLLDVEVYGANDESCPTSGRRKTLVGMKVKTVMSGGP